MMRWRSEWVRSVRRIRVISGKIGPQIGTFSLRRRVRSESGGDRGASAEGENIDIFATTKTKSPDKLITLSKSERKEKIIFRERDRSIPMDTPLNYDFSF